MKTLFLFTKTYPFGEGEQYITLELAYLSPHFQKIIIYPNDHYGQETHHGKTLPANAEVLNLNSKLKVKNSNSIGDYMYLLKNTFMELLATDDKSNFFKNFKWNLINFWTQYQLAKKFGTYLENNGYTNSNSVFYSYWFHKSAILLSVLKDKGRIDKFVARAHSIDLYHQHWGVIDKESKVPSFKYFKLRHAFNIITISKHGAEFIANHFPKFRRKVINSYLGVKAPAELHQRQSEFLIVTCSHLDWTKRVDHLAEALTQIAEPCRWVHFGGGADSELKKIKEAEQRMPSNIKVELKGYVSNREVTEFYAGHFVNLFVNLSLVEGVPVSVMEALSYHIPVLATNVYGNPEAVADGRNGFLIDVNFSVAQLVEKIRFCMEHPALLENMRKESFALFQERFNAEKNYTEFANYLAHL